MRSFISKIASRCLLRSISPLPPTWRLGRPTQSPLIHRDPRRMKTIYSSSAPLLHARLAHTATTAETEESDDIPQPSYVKPGAEALPVACPGCGAFTQWVEPEEAGFYSFDRKPVKQYIRTALSGHPGHGTDDTGSAKSHAEQPSAEVRAAGQTGGNVESPTNAADTGATAERPSGAVNTAEDTGVTAESQADTAAAGTSAKQHFQGVNSQDGSGGTVEPQRDTTTTRTRAPEKGSDPVAEEVEKASGEVLESTSGGSTVGTDEKETQIAVDPTPAESKPEQKSTSHNEASDQPIPLSPPLCDRCHSIEHHNNFKPIAFPPISYIRDIMDESPFDHNHVYHIVDAADFPLSAVTNIHRHLDVQKLRSRNRRAKTNRFHHGKGVADLHIVVTRADLLAPLSDQVDKLMPVMLEALRDALGSKGQRLRLGNVHMVSAHRGWRTKDIKNQIWKHGGAVWMVGRTNVGKSNLISQVFPKTASGGKKHTDFSTGRTQKELSNDHELDTDSLLPPPQKIATWPILPVISSGPGTTASPIRIPFGGKRGEVIDLPGLKRNGLDEFVKEKHRLDLVTTSRPKPTRLAVKSGQSLVLDQLIRITPLDPDLVILAAPFVPLKPNVVPTDEAVKVEKGERKSPAKCIANDDAPGQMSSAGVFELKWDATRIYGDERHMGGEKDVQLYRLMVVDILVEGSGWVELLCQVRTKNRSADDFPKVEIFSPKGQFVGSRRSLCAWRFILEREQHDKKKRRKKLSARLHGHAV